MSKYISVPLATEEGCSKAIQKVAEVLYVLGDCYQGWLTPKQRDILYEMARLSRLLNSDEVKKNE